MSFETGRKMKYTIAVTSGISAQIQLRGGAAAFLQEGIKMKRVKAACICQTLHFQLKEDVEHNSAVKLVREEVAHYQATLDRNRTKYHPGQRRAGAGTLR